MAEEKVSILKVDTKDAVENINDLKNNIKKLKERLGELTIGEDKYKDTLEELKINQNALRDAMYATTASLSDVMAAAQGANVQWDNQNKLVNKGTLSYNELVHTMAALKEEWRATNDQAERDKIGQQIAEINQQLKDMDASVGNYQRNVGNYEGALEKLAGGFMATAGGAGAVINPIKNVTMGFKALSATPVIGILGLLANVISMVIKNLHTSEENTNRLTIAFAPLKTSATIMTKTFQWLGDKLADVAEWMTKVLGKLGLISKLGGEHQDIAKEEVALVEERRKVEMENADAQLEIAKLKAQTAEKDKYTAKERLAFIEEAAKKEREIADRNIEIARREYAVLEQKSKLAGNSKEENDKLKDAYIKLQQAETDYLNKTRELNSQRVEAISSIKSETKETEKLVETKKELADVDKALAEGQKKIDEEIKMRMDAEKEMVSITESMWEEATTEADAVLEEYYNHQWELYEEDRKRAEETAKAKIATMEQVASSTSGILSTIADLYEQDEENAEKNAKKVKALRIAAATIDMLQGAVGAFSQASSTYPPPYGQIIGATSAAAVIAAGVANIAKIKATNPGSGTPSVSAPAAVTAPNVDTQLTTTRNVTSASEEERLNRMASPQKVYILQSDIEAAGTQSKVQVSESSF